MALWIISDFLETAFRCLNLSSAQKGTLHIYIFHVIEPRLCFEILDRNMPSMLPHVLLPLHKGIFYNYLYLDNLES